MYTILWLIAGLLGLIIAFIATPKVMKKIIATIDNVLIVFGLVILGILAGAFTLVAGILYALIYKAIQS
jgi:hypothetical protein